MHIASLSCVVSPGAEVLLDWMQTVTSGVSYDINVRPTVITDPAVYWARVEPWLAAVGRRRGILKASDVDIEFLARAAGGSDPALLARQALEHDVPLIGVARAQAAQDVQLAVYAEAFTRTGASKCRPPSRPAPGSWASTTATSTISASI